MVATSAHPDRQRKGVVELSGYGAKDEAMALIARPWFFLALLLILLCPTTTLIAADDTFDQDSVLSEANEFLGDGAEGIAEVIEKIFADMGRPNAFIKGQEASGALVIGARYGNGTLHRKGGNKKVHWSGPSIGFDAGANASKVFVLIYHLPNVDALFQRFPAIDGSFYFVGGVSANYHQSGDIILAPVRLGAGLRAGVNIGYMKYTRKKTWNPF